MNHPISASILERARRVTPGGVNTSIRRVEPMPVWSRAAGSRVYDVQGREYIDYHAAFGPAILGHCHPGVNRRVRETLDEIDLLGVGTTEWEIRLAEKIVQHVPSAEMALLCNTGSEATHHAVRLSRAVTGRRKFINSLEGPAHSYEDLLRNDDRQQVRYRQLLLKRGIFKLPMSLKRSHIGGAHTEEDIDRTLSAAEDAFRRLVHGESRPVALQSVGTESGEPK